MVFLKSVLNQLLLLECEKRQNELLETDSHNYFIYYHEFSNKFLKSTYLVSKRWKYLIEKEIYIPTIIAHIKQLSNINIDKMRGFKTLRYFNILDSPTMPADYQNFKKFLQLFFKDFKYTDSEFYKHIESYLMATNSFKEYELSVNRISTNQGDHLIQELERFYSIVKCNRYLKSLPGTLKVQISQKLTPEQHLRVNALLEKLNIERFSLEGLNPMVTQRTRHPIIISSPTLKYVKTVVEDTCNRSKWFEHLFKSNPNLRCWSDYCQNRDSIFVESLCNHKKIQVIHLSSMKARALDLVKFLETNESLKLFSSETVFEGSSKIMRRPNNSLETIRILHPTQELINVLGDNIKNLTNLKEIVASPEFKVDVGDYMNWGYLFNRMNRPIKVIFHDHYSDQLESDPASAAEMKKTIEMLKMMAKLSSKHQVVEDAHYTSHLIKSNYKMIQNFTTNEDFDINTMKSNKSIEKLSIQIDRIKQPDNLLKIINFSKTLKVLTLIHHDTNTLKKIQKSVETSSSYQIKNCLIKPKKKRAVFLNLHDKDYFKLIININK